MAGSKESYKKAHATLLKKYGGEEGLRRHRQESGRKGGKARFEGKGFAGMTPEKRREAGRRGGLNRGKNKTM